MITTYYNKLVRDKIPQIIRKSGKKPIIATLTDESYQIYLERKLFEETGEYYESKSLEELADILEVVIALAQLDGCSFADLIDLQAKKAVERGSFSKKILLLEVQEDEKILHL